MPKPCLWCLQSVQPGTKHKPTCPNEPCDVIATRAAKPEPVSANGITATLLIEIPKRWPNARVLRRNVGQGIGAATVAQIVRLLHAGEIKAAIQMLRSRHVKFGVAGETDIEGLIGPNGRAMFIEVKAGNDRMNEDQERFRAMVLRLGAIHIVARSVEQALRDLALAIDGGGR